MGDSSGGGGGGGRERERERAEWERERELLLMADAKVKSRSGFVFLVRIMCQPSETLNRLRLRFAVYQSWIGCSENVHEIYIS
jgi:hypothetical protein